jgi:ERCC4 domain
VAEADEMISKRPNEGRLSSLRLIRLPGRIHIRVLGVLLLHGNEIDDWVLARPRLARSQFVFTETRGRPAIFWQTQRAARAANPGARIPRARALPGGFTIFIDTRERYPYRFAGRDVKGERMALPAGDYAVANAEATIAVVERKTLENFTTSLSDGTLAFQMQRLGEVARAAVVVEGRYSALFTLEHVPAAFIADGLARLQVRYPEIPVVFADSRKFAEEWTYRFLAAAFSDAESGDPVAERRVIGFRTPSSQSDLVQLP